MRKGLVVHGALLGAALLLGLQTWTRDTQPKNARTTVVVWDADTDDVDGLAFHDVAGEERRDVTMERRRDAAGTYLWGSVVRTATPPKPKPPAGAPDAGAEAAAMSTPQPAPKVTTKEFPIGQGGLDLLARIAPLRAVRALGALDDKRKADYGLVEAKAKLIVRLKGTPRELLVGNRVFGGDDRYVLDSASGKGYVLPSEIFRPLEAAEYTLREQKVHAFKPSAVAKVVVKWPAKERTLLRKEPPTQVASTAASPLARPTWSDVTAPDKPDQTLANFMERVEQLTPVEFVKELPEAELTEVLSVTYQGKDGKALGRTVLYKKPGANAGQLDYYVKSEQTRVYGKVIAPVAQRVEQDLATL